MQAKDLKTAIVAFMEEKSYKPMTADALIEAIPEKEFSASKFWQVLMELEQEGRVLKNRQGRYGVPERLGFVAGRFQQTSKGFGFVIPDDKIEYVKLANGETVKQEKPDVFIPAALTGTAMNNDRVLAHITSNQAGKKPEGEILQVITHANNKVVGIFHLSGEFGFVVPDDKRIGQDVYVMRKHFNGAKDMQKVMVEITQWPQEKRKAEGKIVEVLGNLGDVGLEILSIIKQHDLPLEFPPNVIAASEKVPKTIKKSETNGRQDRRDRLIVTVDGEDAKDLDDAIYVEKLDENDYLLGVYIADVSYYVKEDSILDKEARERGTSVYLVDRVLPMLPTRLSNGICSLNAGEDRLAMACEMHIDKDGKVFSYEIFPTVINVRYRLSYNIVRGVLGGDEELRKRYADAIPMLERAEELRVILKSMRHRRGAVDFDLPEQKVILDEKLKPVEIVQRPHGDAENLIEEFMLAANETVAKHMYGKQYPLVYRVHDIPNENKMQDLAKLLANFNVKFVPGEEVKPMELQQAMAQMEGRPELRMVTTVALRSMKQAVYQTENIGHFGLAAEYYCHFTSPIRRYPDLLVHRMLRQWMAEPLLNEKKAEELIDKLDVMAEHSSERERAAAEAERATVELKKCEYMSEHIGEEYDGVVSGVTSYGMFVELENGVEGLVHISSLVDDYYDYIEERYALVGEHTGHQYRLGDSVRIEVLQVSIEDVTVDFIMAGENAGVREHIKAQLQAKQSHASISQKRKSSARRSRSSEEFAFGDESKRGSRKKSDRKKTSGSRRSRGGSSDRASTKGSKSKDISGTPSRFGQSKMRSGHRRKK